MATGTPAETKFCQDCGQQIRASAKHCDRCGVKQPIRQQDQQRQQQQQQPQPQQSVPSTRTQELDSSPLWPILVLGGLWTVWIYLAREAFLLRGDYGALLGVCVLLSLPLMFIDARNGINADELQVSKPWYVPAAMMLMWAVSLPFYVLYRVYSRL